MRDPLAEGEYVAVRIFDAELPEAVRLIGRRLNNCGTTLLELGVHRVDVVGPEVDVEHVGRDDFVVRPCLDALAVGEWTWQSSRSAVP